MLTLHTHTHIHALIHTHTQIGRERERERQKEKDRKKDLTWQCGRRGGALGVDDSVTHTHTLTQTERERERETERQRERDKEREGDLTVWLHERGSWCRCWLYREKETKREKKKEWKRERGREKEGERERPDSLAERERPLVSTLALANRLPLVSSPVSIDSWSIICVYVCVCACVRDDVCRRFRVLSL